MINLDERLGRIAEFVPSCEFFADIGADHGLLSAKLLLMGRCQRAELVDVSAPSLEKARALMDRLGLSLRARITVGDGAKALHENPDCAVIAGMGGPTIAEIVENGEKRLKNSLIVMQPNVGMYDLRRRLSLAGYRVADEAVVSAAGRWYVIIAAESGKSEYADAELMAGPVLLSRGGGEFKKYALFRIAVAEKALAVKREGLDGPTLAMRKELAIWRDVEKNL